MSANCTYRKTSGNALIWATSHKKSTNKQPLRIEINFFHRFIKNTQSSNEKHGKLSDTGCHEFLDYTYMIFIRHYSQQNTTQIKEKKEEGTDR